MALIVGGGPGGGPGPRTPSLGGGPGGGPGGPGGGPGGLLKSRAGGGPGGPRASEYPPFPPVFDPYGARRSRSASPASRRSMKIDASYKLRVELLWRLYTVHDRVQDLEGFLDGRRLACRGQVDWVSRHELLQEIVAEGRARPVAHVRAEHIDVLRELR